MSAAVTRPDRWHEHGQPMPPPPENLEAEQAILAAILANNRVFDRLTGVLTADDFADPDHQAIYEAAARMIEKGQKANAVTLKGSIAESSSMAAVGGATAYLVKLQASGVGTAMVADYARIVSDLAQRRRAMEIARRLYEEAADGLDPQPVAEQVLAATMELGEIGLAAAKATGSGPRGLQEIGQKALDEVEEALKLRASGQQVGISTGLYALDEWVGALRPGQLVIVGGRTSMGKTALAETFAWSAARNGKACLFFSFEMRAEELIEREAARHAGLSLFKLLRGDISPKAFEEQLLPAVRDLSTLPLKVDDRSPRRAGPILAHARQAKRRGAIDLLIIDYLQLMHGDERGRQNRNLELSEITASLKALAMELAIPVVLLSQVNRNSTDRENRRPQLSDLRDSGAIEQDADLVLLLHREHYYLEKEEPQQKAGEAKDKFTARQDAWLQQLGASEGKGEIIVAKQRQGRTGIVHLLWDGPAVRYRDMEGDARAEETLF